MRSVFHAVVGASGLFLPLAACSQEPAATPPSASATASNPALDAIRARSTAFAAAFNQHDAKAVAAFWTPQGEYVDEAGERFVGRSEIEAGYIAFFQAFPDAEMSIAVDEIRLLTGSAALEDGSVTVTPAPSEPPGTNQYTSVYVNEGGQWLLASVRDQRREPPAAAQAAADLEWLVGDWAAEEHGVKMESSCDWVVEGRFLQRRHTTIQVDGEQATGMQIIGWNPLSGHVQSWDFSAEGGHATGVWTPTEDGWQAEVFGTTGEGLPTAATNQLRRLDDGAYVWQSRNRTLGDLPLPDSEEIVIKRRATD